VYQHNPTFVVSGVPFSNKECSMQTRRPLFVSGTTQQQPSAFGSETPEQLLRDAVTNRNYSLVEYLLIQDTDVNHSDGRATPLVIASWGSDLQMVQLLLKYGARADLPSPDNNYPSLLGACFTPQVPTDIIAALRRAGAVDTPATQPQHRTLAELAALNGRSDILQLL
jgi:ankyrin repeat protein